MTASLSRRGLLGGVLLAPVVAVGVASCAAAPVAVAAFDPVVDGWFVELATNLGANVIGAEVTKALDGVWSSWQKPINKALDSMDTYFYPGAYGHPVPPVALLRLSAAKKDHPPTDSLAAFVEGGNQLIVFKPWAWQGMSMFVHSLTQKLKGDDLAAYRALLALTLAPSGKLPVTGSSPEGSVDFVTYQARNGVVEIVRFDTTVQISVSGIPTAQGKPTVRKFTLPASGRASN
jgi:hypothetical protein